MNTNQNPIELFLVPFGERNQGTGQDWKMPPRPPTLSATFTNICVILFCEEERKYRAKFLSTARIRHTEFRVDPTYSRYVTWSKLLVQCVLPVVLLVFFNKKIYQVRFCGDATSRGFYTSISGEHCVTLLLCKFMEYEIVGGGGLGTFRAFKETMVHFSLKRQQKRAICLLIRFALTLESSKVPLPEKSPIFGIALPCHNFGRTGRGCTENTHLGNCENPQFSPIFLTSCGERTRSLPHKRRNPNRDEAATRLFLIIIRSTVVSQVSLERSLRCMRVGGGR